jgi:nitrogen regulatory protein PII
LTLNTTVSSHQLATVIVNFGVGSKVLKLAKSVGVTGGTICLGKGTVKSALLDILDLNDIRKEIVMMVADTETASLALEAISRGLRLDKPNHGIAFSTNVAGFIGTHGQSDVRKEFTTMEGGIYDAIYTVVDRGKGEDVVEAASSAGSKGATIINARGSGIHEKQTLFSIAVEPEKEIVMILAEKELTDSIIAKIRETLRIDEPGAGIVFVLEVNKTYGLYR